jgi:REP element-mobilizing transposase RayT
MSSGGRSVRAGPEDNPEDLTLREIKVRHGAYLPHWAQEGATYFVTFRLHDSLPADVVEKWSAERREILENTNQAGRQLSSAANRWLDELHSERVEAYLNAGHGACWLTRPRIARSVADAILHFDGERYEALAWCVMPNHVHVVVRPLPGHELSAILHSWKSYSAHQASKLLRRTGPFWQTESYDHLVRDEADLIRCVEYVMTNPEKAGLSSWPWRGARGSRVDPTTHRRDADATSDTQP